MYQERSFTCTGKEVSAVCNEVYAKAVIDLCRFLADVLAFVAVKELIFTQTSCKVVHMGFIT